MNDLLERAIVSKDNEIRALATKVWMSIGATAFQANACCDGDESVLNASLGTIDVREFEDSSEAIFSALGLTPDDATELITQTLRRRAEARRKSGFYGTVTDPTTE